MSTENKLSRRGFFSHLVDGVHGAALASLLGKELFSAPGTPPAKARAVIHLFMNGGPSHLDMFDPKPALTRLSGSPAPRDVVADVEFTNAIGSVMPSPFQFQRHGKAGIELSELVPGLASVIEDVCLIRSMHSEHFNHPPALYLMQTGRTIPGLPSLGAWVSYGLGSENKNLPAYVVLDDPKGLPLNGIENWGSGWLNPKHQGTRFRSEGTPVLNLKPAENLPNVLVEARRELLRQIDRAHRSERRAQPHLDARISNYELAARMQLEATDVLDLSQESEETREMYGLSQEQTQSYGRRCLMARRLVERGVRFVQIFIERQVWDVHSHLVRDLGYICRKTDQPIAALIKDLKRRGLLDSTLVIYGGEFGRLPLSQARDSVTPPGRDHNPSGFTMWMAGGGVKGGLAYGATDDIGHKAVENRVSAHDFHATMLHLLGVDFRDLVHDRHGLKERLTGQYPARVITDILT